MTRKMALLKERLAALEEVSGKYVILDGKEYYVPADFIRRMLTGLGEERLGLLETHFRLMETVGSDPNPRRCEEMRLYHEEWCRRVKENDWF